MAPGESPRPSKRCKGRKNDFPEPFQSKIGICPVEHRKLDQFESLGKGATCTVYRAEFEGREVAMKSYPGADQETFKHEISLFSGLDHPNVPEFYFYAINKRRCSIAMEKMDGDLERLMQDRMTKAETDNCPPFKIVEAVDIIHQIAEGVNYLHKNKIVHRDLKSPNILYKMVEGESTSGTRFMNVKVADFGLSTTKEKSKTYSNLTPNLGTSRWMPPELIQPTKLDGQVNTADSESVLKLPFKCDVYSFAMVCFEIMTGEVPFSNTKSEGVLEMVVNGERPSFPKYCPCHLPDHCHPKLKALIEECWNQEPSERPSFTVICQKLKDLKGLLLAGLTSSQRPLPAINDASSSAGTNVDPSHVSKHDLLEPKPMESMGDLPYVQGRLRFLKVVREKIEQTPLSPAYGVQVVGLYGMVGIGKTTICKALCNELSMEFGGAVCHLELDSASELELMRAVSKRLTNSTHELLDRLNLYECYASLYSKIRERKVFLAIDNISDSRDTIEQGRRYLRVGYAPGSLVLVAARSLGQLQSLGIDERNCFQMLTLEEDEARSLLLYHASPEYPVDEEIVKQCVQRCYFSTGDGVSYHYHPLALAVLGTQLGHDPRDWVTQVDEVDAFNHFQDKQNPVFSILRTSFDALLYEDQLLYMDAVLYYPERPIGVKPWNNIFEWLGMVHGSSANNIRMRLMILKRKALLEDLGDGSTSIGVHHLWREFCVRESNTGQLEYRRWVYTDQEMSEERALLLHGGWKELRRVCLRGSNFRINSVNKISLMYCTKVRVLKLVNCRVEDQVLDLRALKQLKSLEIQSCLISLSKDSPVEIFGLGLQKSLVVLKWDNIPRQSPCIEEIGCLTELQVLDLVSGQKENKLPNVGNLLFLREAKFCYSDGADTIEGLSSRMTNLRYLDLGGCHHLRTCPGVGDLDALEELDLSGCSMLRELPNLRKLTNLVKLVITGCHSIRGLVGLGDLVSLQELRAGSCWGLTEFPDMIMLTNLQVLDILYVDLIQVRGLGNLLALQELRIDALRLEGRPDLYRFTRLKTLHVNGWGPQGLPSVTNLGNLKRLTILDCSGVDEVAGLLNLTGLEALCFRHCEFKDVSGLCNLTALQRLEVHYCSKLESFPDMHMLTRLELLDVMSCRSLRHWEGVSTPSRFSRAASNVGTPLQLERLRFRGLPITQIPDLSDFPRLKELDIVHCGDLTSLISTGPLTALEVLRLYGCTSLRALPDLSCAVGLRSFTLYNCGVQLDAEEIKKLKSMLSALVLHPQDVELEEPQ